MSNSLFGHAYLDFLISLYSGSNQIYNQYYYNYRLLWLSGKKHASQPKYTADKDSIGSSCSFARRSAIEVQVTIFLAWIFNTEVQCHICLILKPHCPKQCCKEKVQRSKCGALSLLITSNNKQTDQLVNKINVLEKESNYASISVADCFTN